MLAAFIPIRLLKTIHTVCSDMYEGFTEAAREEIKTAQLVIDRFHVTRKYRDSVDSLRKQELKRLKEELSQEGYSQLQGSLWALRKKQADLKPEERKVLRTLFSFSHKLELAHTLQLQLGDIFDQKISKPRAKTKIKAWMKRVEKSDLSCFDDFLKTLTPIYAIHHGNSQSPKMLRCRSFSKHCLPNRVCSSLLLSLKSQPSSH